MTTMGTTIGGGIARGFTSAGRGGAFEPDMDTEEEGLLVQTEMRGTIAVVHLTGEIDLHTCTDMRTTLQQLTESGNGNIVVDLAQVPYIDSAGLGVLVDTQRRVREVGGELCLAGAAPFVLRALEITRLIRIFRTADSVDEAVEVLG